MAKVDLPAHGYTSTAATLAKNVKLLWVKHLYSTVEPRTYHFHRCRPATSYVYASSHLSEKLDGEL
jgi:hypothetical protein